MLCVQFVDPIEKEVSAHRTTAAARGEDFPANDAEGHYAGAWSKLESTVAELMKSLQEDLRAPVARDAVAETADPASTGATASERAAEAMGLDLHTLWAKDDADFVAGRLRERAEYWAQVILPRSGMPDHVRRAVIRWLTVGPSVREFAKHFEGRFNGVAYDTASPPRRAGVDHPSVKEHQGFVDETMEGYLRSGALIPWSGPGAPHIVHPQGVAVNTSSGKLRLILDARFLNCFQKPPAVKYDMLSAWKDGIGVGDSMFALDHKSGYLNLRLRAEDQTYFGVRWRGEYYTFTVMPFGWSPACYIYQTLSTCVAAYLRSYSFNTIAFIDDIGCSAPRYLSPKGALSMRFAFFAVWFLAGFYTSRQKSKPALVDRIELLGFGLDSRAQLFYVPEKKFKAVEAHIRSLLAQGEVDEHALVSLVGKLQSLSLAAPAVGLFLRSSYDALKAFAREGDARARVRLTRAMKLDLECVLALRSWDRMSRWRPAVHIRMETDACGGPNGGWGAVLYHNGSVTVVGGPFKPGREAAYHINVQELLAVTLGVRFFERLIPRDVRVDIYVDNTAAQYSGLRGSSPSDDMRALSRELMAWQLRAGVVAHMLRIPTLQNVLADRKSREKGLGPRSTRVDLGDQRLASVEVYSIAEAREIVRRELRNVSCEFVPPRRGEEDRDDHRLAPDLFRRLERLTRRRFTIDVCASRWNTQLPRYIARENSTADVRCVAEDVLAYTFPPYRGGQEEVYCNPPWVILAPVWCHLRQQRCRGVFVFPDLPYMMWYPMLMREARSVGTLVEAGTRDVFSQPSRSYAESVGRVKWDVLYAEFDFSLPAAGGTSC